MANRNQDLLKFNAVMLLNKREVLESFEDYMTRRGEEGPGERWSGEQYAAFLNLCRQFREKLLNCTIPTLTKPWYHYEYTVAREYIRLELMRCEEISFDENGEFDAMTTQAEYTILQVQCRYLTVEEYAALSGVTDTTVRQWIRRGKLRTAKKEGREWRIPELADTPKRGFESVTYAWNTLPEEIGAAFPWLNKAEEMALSQDRDDKTVFHAQLYIPGQGSRRIDLSTKERERLELMLIAAPEVRAEIEADDVYYESFKREDVLPAEEKEYGFGTILVQASAAEAAWFMPDDAPGNSSREGEPEEYLIPISWTFWGVPKDDEAEEIALSEEDYSGCTRIGTLRGYLALCGDMVFDGYDPVVLCDDQSADLGQMMALLTRKDAPLHEETGEPCVDVLLIEELLIDDELRRQGLGSRILQELPWLCRRLLHVWPDVMAYYISDFARPAITRQLKAFYQGNGFKPVGKSRLLYTYARR